MIETFLFRKVTIIITKKISEIEVMHIKGVIKGSDWYRKKIRQKIWTIIKKITNFITDVFSPISFVNFPAKRKREIITNTEANPNIRTFKFIKTAGQLGINSGSLK